VRRRSHVWGVTAVVAVAAAVAGYLATDAATVTIHVQSQRQFEAAVSQLRTSGGTIVLLPHVYRQTLVVGPRSVRPLRIVGAPGARVERVLLDQTQRVSLGRLTVSPSAHDAWVRVTGSERVDLHHLVVTANGTRFSASVQIPDSSRVTVRRSRFTHCGDQSPRWTNCLRLQRWSSHIAVVHNRFHDCRGCDFVHGRFRADLTVRGNRFERALPCTLNQIQRRRTQMFLPRRASERCGHQDLIELFGGNGLRVEGNHFGVYRAGGAQVYLTGPIDHATIANNVFVGTDPRVPFYRARVGLLVGGRGVPHVPQHVKVLHNTILTGAPRVDGYTGSIALSPVYRHVPKLGRPIIVNNIIGVLKTPERVCRGAQAFVSNVVIEGRGCAPLDHGDLASLAHEEIPGSSLPIDFRAILGPPPIGVTAPG
jgi:hypothetical protein